MSAYRCRYRSKGDAKDKAGEEQGGGRRDKGLKNNSLRKNTNNKYLPKQALLGVRLSNRWVGMKRGENGFGF
jgi:hypothetical protein